MSAAVFSWAEDYKGIMVHIDDVPRGLQCGCTCPNCHEQLLARHGEKNEHGFAHHSDTRGANLKICYMVSLYKLAEQIIQTKRRIHVPSYYGIFPENDIEFVAVKIDSSYEREDKQPDVIATTADGKQYLIEFTFDYKVQHKHTIDYKNLNCLEIDLSKQKFESVERFLLEENTDRQWLNNQNYFESIGSLYQKANKPIAIKNENECELCELKYPCCSVKDKNSGRHLVIENSGQRYRLCKQELYKAGLAAYHKKLEEEALHRQQKTECRRQARYDYEQHRFRPVHGRLQSTQTEIVRHNEGIKLISRHQAQEKKCLVEQNTFSLDTSEITCFRCQKNIRWKNSNGYANCGCYSSMGVPKKTPPETAKKCGGFSRIDGEE